MPEATIISSENSIKLRKFGRIVKVSYEAARRTAIDKFALCIKAILRQANVDRATAAYDVLLLGDGNANVATHYHHMADLGATANTVVEYGPWAKFLFRFFPHKMTTLVGGEAELVQFLTMTAPTVDPIRLIEQLRFGGTDSQGTMAQTIFNNYRIVYLPTATATYLLGLDKQFALEMVYEIGTDISEVERLITSQWKEIALSEINGFAIFLPSARKILVLA